MKRRNLLLSGLLAAAVSGGVATSASAQSVTVMAERGPGAAAADYHIARPGDTLFGLSRRYLGDPMLWPLLWSFNPQITNPHWIYPSDVIFLRPPGTPGELEARAEGRFYPIGGFYAGAGEFEHVGVIRYADTGRRLLQPLDTVYLDFDTRDEEEVEEGTAGPDPSENVVVGTEYAINRVIGRVYDDDRELLAVKYEVAGALRVTARHDETDLLSGEITDLWDTIERGDALFLSEPQLLRVTPRVNEVDLDGYIYDVLNPIRHFHEQDYIFVNLGYEDGVRVGNRFRVWDRQDEGEMIRAARERRVDYEEIQAEIPWQNVGQAMVIHVTEEWCTAVVSDAGMRELTTGLRVTMRDGE